MPVRGGVITAGFHEARPLSNPGEHIHGALDIAGGDGMILAPCAGVVRGYVIFRKPGFVWGKDKEAILALPFRDRFEDVYGGFIALTEAGTGRLHLLCHIWPDAILYAHRDSGFGFERYIETRVMDRFPAHVLVTAERRVKEGDILAPIGNAGFSTGAHVHWEIHHQAGQLDTYERRVNPETYL